MDLLNNRKTSKNATEEIFVFLSSTYTYNEISYYIRVVYTVIIPLFSRVWAMMNFPINVHTLRALHTHPRAKSNEAFTFDFIVIQIPLTTLFSFHRMLNIAKYVAVSRAMISVINIQK